MRCEQALRSSESMSLSVSDRLGPLRSAGRRLDIPVYSRCSGGGAAKISGGVRKHGLGREGVAPSRRGVRGQHPWNILGSKSCILVRYG